MEQQELLGTHPAALGLFFYLILTAMIIRQTNPKNIGAEANRYLIFILQSQSFYIIGFIFFIF